MQRCGRLWNRK